MADWADEIPDEQLVDRMTTLRAEIDQLKAYKAEVEGQARVSRVSEAFKDAGIDTAFAPVFSVLNPDIEPTTDDAARFAAEYDLSTTKPTRPENDEPSDGGFTSTVLPGTTMESKVYDHDEAMRLSETNPALLRHLHATGKLRLEKLPGNE